jgi:hypothetical protein
MILATAAFLTGFAGKFQGNCMRSLSVSVRRRLFVSTAGLVFSCFSSHAMALTVSAPMVQEADSLVCKLQEVTGSYGVGQSVAGAGKSLAPPVCRMLQVAVRIAMGAPSGGFGGVEAAAPSRRLGNAVDGAEYTVDVCESAKGLMLFDEHHPFVRRMLVQGGRNPGYGQEVDYVHIRHGFIVQPTAAGEYIRLILAPWFGRVSADQPSQTLQAPEVEGLQMSTTVDAIPGKWMDLGTYREGTFIGDEVVPRRIVGNSREIIRIWVKVDDVNVSN